MSLVNLFDIKKKKVVLIVQCRLSSTRLPRKALLPLGGKTILEWVLASMKKVPANSYYLAVDTDSAEELEPIAKKCGFKFYAGSKDDVLERFCKVIELSKADVVIRATADNPFLFHEAAEDLLAEYKDRSTSSKIDYITWAGLPHGSGVELFDAHSLLKAAQQTDLPYDHEHVGPALYNHKDFFQCLFVRAPRKYYNPELRTTVDLPSDYRRAQALVRVISAEKSIDSPYTTQQILAGLQRNEVRFPVLFVPCTKKGCGTGHLRRCLDLATKLGSDILIPKNPELLQCLSLVEQAQKNGLHSYQIVQDISQAEQYALCVTDLFETDADFAKLLSEKCPVLALDEGASDTNYADYLLDIIPSVGISRKANKVEPYFIPIGKSKKKKIDFASPFSNALVVLGGEDPACLTLPATISLAQCSISVVAIVSTEEQRAEFEKNIPDELKSFVTVSAPIEDLREKLFSYDLVVTHYGFTAFEATAAGCAVILLGTSMLHTQLAKTYGFACIGSNDVNQKSFKKLFEQKENLYRKQDLEGKENLSLSDFISTLSRGKRLLCPVCQCKGKDLVVARTANRTFRRCSSCGMLYMSWTTEEKQTEYNHDYFYDDYKKQYGKTYEDDFAKIKAECVRRTSIIDFLYRHRAHAPVTPSVLDIGCALGPFLDAANDAGWQVFGTDISADVVKYVQEKLHFPALCAAFPQADVTSEFGIDKFDAVTMWYVIEHFQNLDEVLIAVSKLVKKGGIFAFSTPSASGVSAKYNTDSFFSQSPSDHYTLWEPERASSILKKYGFEVLRIVSTGIHPERFPIASKNKWTCDSVQSKVLRSASKMFKLGDTFEIYCKKL